MNLSYTGTFVHCLTFDVADITRDIVKKVFQNLFDQHANQYGRILSGRLIDEWWDLRNKVAHDITYLNNRTKDDFLEKCEMVEKMISEAEAWLDGSDQVSAITSYGILNKH